MPTDPKSITPEQKEALKMLGRQTRGYFVIHQMAGPHNADVRQKIMSILHGQKMPKAKCGVTVMEKAFIELSGITEYTCLADRNNKFEAWAKEAAGDL